MKGLKKASDIIWRINFWGHRGYRDVKEEANSIIQVRFGDLEQGGSGGGKGNGFQSLGGTGRSN